jgi:deoxyribodipyrimidine photolyase-related protein
MATLDTLVLVLGDQLTATSPALEGLDPARDAVLLIEAPGEATHVWSTKPRIAVFLSAMRHFRDELRAAGATVHHVELEAMPDRPGLPERLGAELARLKPRLLRLVEAGEWRLEQAIRGVAAEAGVELQELDDTHFLCSRADFARWAGRPTKPLRMETFYREMRKVHRVLLDADGEPEGGRWNFDAENRKAFPKTKGPGLIPPPELFPPDATTREVIELVNRVFAEHPGSLDDHAWPATRADARKALDVFVAERLPQFGDWQDAMWTETPFVWHSLLSSSLNLHLLDPREVIDRAEAAYRAGDVPLAAAEGFIRQILGWREFIRGAYWQSMPRLYGANHFGVKRQLPWWYWTGETHMACCADAIGQTLRHGYAHHIQRLMVTGLFGLLAEIEPTQVADWYLAVYVDAVEWAELPNVASMALYADGGRITSKPYVASGAYIDRMSNYCKGCRYEPVAKTALADGKPLCPFTAFYWRFLDRHGDELGRNPRLAQMLRNWERVDDAQKRWLRDEAERMLGDLDAL